MTLRVLYYSLLILLAATPQAFSALPCEYGFQKSAWFENTAGSARILLGKLKSVYIRESISSAGMNFPPPANREAQLAQQGFGNKFTASLDLVINEWAVVRRRLEELQADPRNTHIEYFADQIPDHIAYIRKGIEAVLTSSDPNRDFSLEAGLEKLKALKNLEKKAKTAIKNKKVTYQWWLEFNIALSRIMSGDIPRGNHLFRLFSRYNHPLRLFLPQPSFIATEIREHLSEFPSHIFIPTIKGEDIGIIAFRKARENGVYPLGLINTSFAVIDGVLKSSYGAIVHDVIHAGYPANRIRHNAVFRQELGEYIETLPPEKRKKMEIIYFLLTHERSKESIGSYRFSHTPERDLLWKMEEDIVHTLRGNPLGLFKLPDDPVQKQEKIEDLAGAFMEVYEQTLPH